MFKFSRVRSVGINQPAALSLLLPCLFFANTVLSQKTNSNPESLTSQTTQQKLADESAIRFVVDEIDNAVDAKDWKKARRFFTDKVSIDFTSLAGGSPAQITADELIGAWSTNLYAEKKSFHMRSNHRIEISADKGVVVSKGYAYNLIESGKVKGLWEVWGEYRHTLERMNGGWRVSGMSLTVSHQRGDDRIRTYLPKDK